MNYPKLNYIAIPNNATNGDVITIIYPNGIISVGRKKIYYTLPCRVAVMEFDKEWWDAPYEMKERKDYD